MKASVFIAYILLLMYFVVGVAFIYLFVLVVRALKKYIKSEPVRKEKAESAKSLGEVIKRYRTQLDVLSSLKWRDSLSHNARNGASQSFQHGSRPCI